MTFLILGLLLFFGTHFISIVAPSWRNAMVAKLGEKPWKGLYALVSLVGFALMVWGYGQTRHNPIELYAPPLWLRHVNALLMLPVFPLILAAYFPGKIKATLKHPMLAATKSWALAHLLVNGMLGDVLLFGSFLVWAVLDRISFKHRTQGPIAGAPPSKWNDAIAVVLGLVMYVAFIKWFHLQWIGVSPLPL